MKVVNPSIEEQNRIVDYLDRKCVDIEKIITIKNKKIDELTEYKKSLIYEYVTGKKEVF
jgi:type I restriction enzyme S subunit